MAPKEQPPRGRFGYRPSHPDPSTQKLNVSQLPPDVQEAIARVPQQQATHTQGGGETVTVRGKNGSPTDKQKKA